MLNSSNPASPSQSASRPRCNLHIHLPPNFSAFDSVEQVVALAAAQDVRVLGVSNYYDYRVYNRFEQLAAEHRIVPLYGLEIIALLPELQSAGVRINDPGNPGKLYICGKGITAFDPLPSRAGELLEEIRRKDSERMRRMLERMADLAAAAGIQVRLTEQDVKERIARRHGCPVEAVYLQERHLAQAYQEEIFARYKEADRAVALERFLGGPPASALDDAVGLQNEIRSRLMKAGKPAFVPETFVGFEHARALILAMGGIPCYPTLADGAAPICEFETPPEDLIGRIKDWNIHMVEFIPIRNEPDVLERYAVAMRRAGLVITAGTEHNTLDLLPLEPQCLRGQPVPECVKELFWEGACVVAAHQARRREGQSGFVDAEGEPNSDFPDAEARISAFAEMGARVIRNTVEQPLN